MTTQLPITSPEKGYCEGNQERCTGEGCPVFATLLKPSRDGRRRVRGCDDPAARGKRNRAKGDAKARRARRKMGIVGVNSRHEEHLGGPFRVEFKAGKQVQSLWARFLAAEAQSNAERSIGDTRPFAFGAMPDGTTEGVVAVRLSVWSELIVPAIEEFYGSPVA